MDLVSLNCFVVAARLNNFRSAARQTHLSPSAFGERIRSLEEALGAPLFTRTTRSLSLTPAGRGLLDQARCALDAADSCYDAIDAPTSLSLTIGTRYELGMSWLVPQLRQLEKAQEGRSLHLYFGDSPDLLRAVDKGEVDAAITSSRAATSGFDYALLHEEHYRFVGARTLLEHRPFTSPADAHAHRLFDLNEDFPLFRYLLDGRAQKTGWDFLSLGFLGTIGAIRHRTLEGAGVAVLPEYFVRGDLKSGRLQQILPKRRLQTDWFRLVWKRNHPRQKELESLAKELKLHPLR